MREAGATAAQELAFTLADAIAYVEAARRPRARHRRLRRPAQLLLRRLARALRGGRQVPGGPPDVGARSCASASGRQNPRSMMCRFHVQTAGSSLTAQSIDNNVVRTTVQALAAVLGGAQSLHTNSRDEALALPTEEAARLALRTQQILAYEAGVTETPDPLAGSYYVETPDQRARSGRLGLPRRDRRARGHARGGRGRLPAALDPGGRPTASSARSKPATRSSSGSTGSATTTDGDAPRSSGSTPRGSAARSSGVRRVRAERDPADLGGGDGRARGDARRGDGNLMPAIIEAVKAYATVGEISDRLRVGLGRAPRADHGLRTERRTIRNDARHGSSRRRLGRIHHVAVVVRDIETLARLLARHARPRARDRRWPSQTDRVRIAFLPVGESKIELVQPDRRHDRRRAVPRQQGRGLPPRLLRGRRTWPRRYPARDRRGRADRHAPRGAAPRGRWRSSIRDRATASSSS